MRRALATIALGAVAGAAQAEMPAGFAWFAELAGQCWAADFPDGKTRHRQCYTTQFSRFLRGTAQLVVDGKPMFDGDSIYSWDAAGARIVYTIWGSDGQHRQLDARWVDGELHFPVPARADPARIAFRSVWRRLDASSFEVRRERPPAAGEGAWTVELKVVYRPEAGSASR